MKSIIEMDDAIIFRRLILIVCVFVVGTFLGGFLVGIDQSDTRNILDWRLAAKEEKIETCARMLGKDYWKMSFPQ